MSLYLDRKYISLIGYRLRNFKQLRDGLTNCSCPICGDSTNNLTKARGYFYSRKNQMFYKCHHCGASMSFGFFLKQFDTNVYNEYTIEQYRDNASTTFTKVVPTTKIPELEFSPKFKQLVKKPETILDTLLDRVDRLPEDNIAVQYCKQRLIPPDKLKQLYFIDDIRRLSQLDDKYTRSLTVNEPRLVLPFFDDNLQLAAISCRALGPSSLRYITLKIKEDVPLIFGLDKIDKESRIFVVEGPIDSLFLKNAIAVGGTSFGKLKHILPKDSVTIIFDNQPKNREVTKLISQTISSGYSVVIWPQRLVEKDINEMILSGKTSAQVEKMILTNTYSGLTAQVKFMEWARV